MPYWEDRQISRYKAGERLVNQYYKDLEKAFIQAKKEIQQVIDMFYMRYADENGVTYAKARKLLSKAEIGELKDFVDKVKANMGKYNLEIENMSIKARVTRYEALEKQVDVVLQQLYAVDYEYNGSLTLEQVYKGSYYQTWYNIDQYTGFHKEFAQISPSLIDTYINYPFDGAKFSTRLWKQKAYLQQQINEAMTTMMIQGKHPSTLSKGFAKKFGRGQWEAYRLLHTEASFIMSQATHDVYKEDGVDKYEYIATLDSRTCEICRPLDKKVFDTEDAVTGVNMAPMHALCRCTDAPYYEDTPKAGMKRIARDPETGESYKVPVGMSYDEWHTKYIENDPQKALAELKVLLKNGDMEQYKDYKAIFGYDIAESFAEFQDMKYTKGEKWKEVKAEKQSRINQMDFSQMGKLKERLGNKEVRLWYKSQDEKIPNLVDGTKSSREQAIRAFNLRNEYRTQARELMKDKKAREELDRNHKNPSFEQIMEHKKKKYGLTDEEAYQDIIRSSATTNKKYDRIAGVDREEEER